MASLDMSGAVSLCVSQETKGGKTKSVIKWRQALNDVYSQALPNGSISDYLYDLRKHVTAVAHGQGWNAPDDNAFNKVNGDWFEALIAVLAWNYFLNLGIQDMYIVRMPNVARFDFREIFEPEARQKLEDLERHLTRHGVNLATSNPDLLVIRQENLFSGISRPIIEDLSLNSVNQVSEFYAQVRGRCRWNSLVAGIGLKTSLRPDRRYQLVHEGNTLKSIFDHLKARYWSPEPIFKYFVATNEKTSLANDAALRAATTSSVVNVNSKPERAVDGIYALINSQDIENILKDILLISIGS